ncbi:MAG: tetratricopeptide repeat protein [Chloroflexi bacterium]|nr:tetratricopeptide repeat protein [Chloroflexota bacterium]
MARLLFDGRYHIAGEIGRGGTSIVYAAVDLLTGQTVALKRLHFATSPEYARPETRLIMSTATRRRSLLSLAEEFRMHAGLRHPNITPVLDFGLDDESMPYLTTLFISQASPITTYGAGLPLQQRALLFIQMLQALSYLHRRSIIHCDLKPTNVLVDPSGIVKVLDFGLSKRAAGGGIESGIMSGTLAYMSPEQVRGETLTTRTDLYAAGILAFELFAGFHPFNTKQPSELIADILSGYIGVHRAPTEISAIVLRLMMNDPRERYADADAVILDLCAALSLPMPKEDPLLLTSALQSASFVGREREMVELKTTLRRVHPATPDSQIGAKPLNGTSLPGQGSPASAPGQAAESAPGSEGLDVREKLVIPEVVLIGGETGVGKSRLLGEFRIHALLDGWLVARGSAEESGSASYAIWHDPILRLALDAPLDDRMIAALKRIVPTLDARLGRQIPQEPALDSEGEQLRLAETVIELIKSQNRPVLILLEDLQWAAEDLWLIRRLAAAPIPVMIVGTFRDDQPNTVIEQVPGAQLIRLPRLTQQETEQLIRSLVGGVDTDSEITTTLHRETEGNAFFLTEFMRILAERAGSLRDVMYRTLPVDVIVGGMQTVVKDRLGRIPQTLLPALKQIAVLGRVIDPVLAGDLIGDMDRLITVCANNAVLEYDDGNWRFSHHKLRDGMLEMLSAEEYVMMHRRAAEAIEKIYPDDVAHYDALINHWQQASEFDKQIRYTLTAAEVLIRQASLKRALAVLEQAINVIDPDADARYPRLLRLVGDALARQSDFAPALQSYTDSANAARKINDSVALVDALTSWASVAWRQQQLTVALQTAEEAVRLSRSIDYLSGLAKALTALGMVRLAQSEYTLARTALLDSRTLYRRLNDASGELATVNSIAFSYSREGRLEAARAIFQQMLDLARSIGDVFTEAAIVNNLGMLAYRMGALIDAELFFDEALTLRRRIGDRNGQADSLSNLGLLAARRLDYTAAWHFYREALDIAARTGELRSIATIHNNLGDLFLLEGETKNARVHFLSALKLSSDQGAMNETMEALLGLARGLLAEEQPARAAVLLGLVQKVVPSDRGTALADAMIPLAHTLREELSGSVLEASLAEGRALDLNAAVTQLLTQNQNHNVAPPTM